MAIICVDLDGVVCDFNSAYTKLLMKINPTIKVDYLAADFPTEWDWDKAIGFTYADREAAWTEIKHSGLFWRSLFPYPTAWEDLSTLYDLRKQHDIYFVTARPGLTAKQESEEWLRGHGFPGATVIIAIEKELIVNAVKADCIIDDNPKNLLYQTNTKTILFKRPYNKLYWNSFNQTVTTVREALDGL